MKLFLVTLCVVSAVALTSAQTFGRGQTPTHGQVLSRASAIKKTSKTMQKIVH